MNIFVFGNEDLQMDSLPLRILPMLRKEFPEIRFETLDTNEEWEVPEETMVLDTAVGIKEIKIFEDLEKFVPAPRVGMHDFDALANLRLLQKLGRLKNLKVICIPASFSEEKALDGVRDKITLLFDK